MNFCINYLSCHVINNAFSSGVCVALRFVPIYLSICTGILRYLGGRFPETTSAVDEHGRTALHYAATIKDNGHFYNLLVHLGSNPKAIDKVNRSVPFNLLTIWLEIEMTQLAFVVWSHC